MMSRGALGRGRVEGKRPVWHLRGSLMLNQLRVSYLFHL